MTAESIVPTQVNRLICSMPRSGGNMLLDVLEQSGAGHVGEWPQRLPDNATIALVHLHYVDHIERTPDRAIYLYRRDVLAQAVSWAAAYQTGNWLDGRPTGPMHLRSGEVVSLAGELMAAQGDWLDWLSERSVETLPVAYEDIVSNERALGRAVKFLGGDPAKIDLKAATTRKQATWVNDAYVDGERFNLERLVGGNLGDRLARARQARGYKDRKGKRRDGLA